jgi:hypothetical protein
LEEQTTVEVVRTAVTALSHRSLRCETNKLPFLSYACGSSSVDLFLSSSSSSSSPSSSSSSIFLLRTAFFLFLVHELASQVYCSPACFSAHAEVSSVEHPVLAKLSSLSSKHKCDLDLLRLILRIAATRYVEFTAAATSADAVTAGATAAASNQPPVAASTGESTSPSSSSPSASSSSSPSSSSVRWDQVVGLVAHLNSSETSTANGDDGNSSEGLNSRRWAESVRAAANDMVPLFLEGLSSQQGRTGGGDCDDGSAMAMTAAAALLVQRALAGFSATSTAESSANAAAAAAAAKANPVEGEGAAAAVSAAVAAETAAASLDVVKASLSESFLGLAARVNSNSHGMRDEQGRNSNVGIGLFPLFAMLNHSCRPNCAFAFK